jgi:hypothetical protein
VERRHKRNTEQLREPLAEQSGKPLNIVIYIIERFGVRSHSIDKTSMQALQCGYFGYLFFGDARNVMQ